MCRNEHTPGKMHAPTFQDKHILLDAGAVDGPGKSRLPSLGAAGSHHSVFVMGSSGASVQSSGGWSVSLQWVQRGRALSCCIRCV